MVRISTFTLTDLFVEHRADAELRSRNDRRVTLGARMKRFLRDETPRHFTEVADGRNYSERMPSPGRAWRYGPQFMLTRAKP
jgi:hypothetical protein